MARPASQPAGRVPIIKTDVLLLRDRENRYPPQHQFSGLNEWPGATSALEEGLKMVTSRHLFPLLVAIFVLAIATASAVNGADSDSGKVGGAQRALSSELAGGWHLVRTHNPNGGTDAISIMHTADTSRSDLDLVGLMIRCSETSTEVVIVILPALPFRTRPHVALGKPGNETKFEATVAPPGTAVLLPRDPTTLVSGPWQALEDLFIQIDDGQSTIRGVVKLTGLQAAFKELQASCAAH
jgi:hypothetical protein